MGWIGVDFDGTLAHQQAGMSFDRCGSPVPKMVARVKQWLAVGYDVRVFTARVGFRGEEDQQRKIIGDWCDKHVGKRLPVTNVKDGQMIQLWDDRAVQIIHNTGERADGQDD